MPTAPTAITALPPAPNPDDDESTFDTQAYAFTAAQPACVTQMNALGANMYANALEAVAAAEDAADDAAAIAGQIAAAQASAKASADSAAAALVNKNGADAAAAAADASKKAAADSATAAASAAAGLIASSTSSLLIGLGAKSFVTQAGKQFSIGAWVMAASAANPANYIFGQVASYSGSALVLDVQVVGGSGTFADWALSVSGVRGATGATGPVGPAIDYAVLAESALIALPVTSAASTLRHVVIIDANRVCLIFGGTAALQGIAYDRSTKLFGAGFLIRSGASLLSSAILSATDKILVTSVAGGAAAFEAVVLSFSGTAGTVNTAATATLPENTTGVVIAANAAVVGSTFVFGLALASSNRTIAVTVSGTTPSIGTSVTLPGSTTTGQITVRGIDTTRALATYTTGSNILFCPITVSAGTTLTPGTQASTAMTGTQFYGPYALSSGRFAAAYNNTNSYGVVVSVSGTVASVSTVLLGTANVGTCVKVGDRLLVGSNGATVNALTDLSGTATAGTSVAISTHTLVGHGPDYVAYSSGAGPNSYTVVKLSGNNLVISETAGCSPFAPGISTGADEVLPRILNLNGKSASVASTHQFSLVFSATGIDPKLRLSSPEPLSTPVMQSASVGWCIGSAGGATYVKLIRVEMV